VAEITTRQPSGVQASASGTDQTRYITDEQLVSSFPPGSCFIAEVDGRKELVFFDPAVERRYVAGVAGP
jgi:hypothetical protein